jgi:hypothetical protein
VSNNISVQVNLTGQEVRKIIDVRDGQFQNIRFILLESIMDIITYQCHDMSWLSHRHQFYFSTPWISVSILKEMEIDIVKWVKSGRFGQRSRFVLIGYINVNKGVFCLIISYLRIKSYNWIITIVQLTGVFL